MKVVGVNFKNKGRIYYFSPNDLEINNEDYVVVETERGLQYGKVKNNAINIDNAKIIANIKPVVRIASDKDHDQYQKNLKDASRALIRCRKIVEKQKLNMYIVDASYTFDRDQLLFHFLSDNRVDFRSLAKELASIYKTRIELRQIGVRDKAKEIGGLGICGLELCCSRFLNDFDSVSINMAKNQNIALNPSKINGICGRLLCCLKYEDECYVEKRKGMPKVGAKVSTPKGEGIVKSIDILKRSYVAEVKNIGDVEVVLND